MEATQESAPAEVEQTQATPEATEEQVPESFGIFEEETQEAPAEEAPAGDEPAPEDARLANAYEELARKEREFKARTHEFKNQSGAVNEMREIQEIAKNDPFKALEKLGLDFDQVIDQYIQRGSGQEAKEKSEPAKENPEVIALKQRLEQLEQQTVKQRHASAHSNMIGVLNNKISDRVADLPVLSRIANRPGIMDQVLEAVTIEYEQTGEAPDLDDILGRAEQVFSANIKDTLGIAREAGMLEQHKAQPAQSEPTSRSQTLTNDMMGDTPLKDEREMTDQEQEDFFVKLLKKDGWVDEE